MAPIFDASVPDAFPASCDLFTLAIEPDGASSNSALEDAAYAPATVECSASGECAPNLSIAAGCACVVPVFGINSNAQRYVVNPCNGPPGPPPVSGCAADASGFYTQDCNFAADWQHVAVTCFNGRCMTYSARSE